MQQWSCWNGDMQKFQLIPVQGGYQIKIKLSGLTLDMEGGPSNTALGARMLQWEYWGGANQIYRVVPTTDGYYNLIPTHSNLCVDVRAWSQDNGAAVQQWSCHGGDNQKWKFVPVQ
jgi:hypothetical protein